MKNIILLFSFLLATIVCFSQNLIIDKSKSSIDFTIKNAGFTVEGNFSEFEIEANFDKNNLPNSYFKGTASIKSINTGINARNNSLQEEEYFDAKNHPKIEITSTKIEQKTGDQYLLVCLVKIKGITIPTPVWVTIEETANNLIAKGNFEISRLNFKVGGKSWFMDDKVKVSITYVGKK